MPTPVDCYGRAINGRRPSHKKQTVARTTQPLSTRPTHLTSHRHTPHHASWLHLTSITFAQWVLCTLRVVPLHPCVRLLSPPAGVPPVTADYQSGDGIPLQTFHVRLSPHSVHSVPLPSHRALVVHIWIRHSRQQQLMAVCDSERCRECCTATVECTAAEWQCGDRDTLLGWRAAAGHQQDKSVLRWSRLIIDCNLLVVQVLFI